MTRTPPPAFPRPRLLLLLWSLALIKATATGLPVHHQLPEFTQTHKCVGVWVCVGMAVWVCVGVGVCVVAGVWVCVGVVAGVWVLEAQLS